MFTTRKRAEKVHAQAHPPLVVLAHQLIITMFDLNDSDTEQHGDSDDEYTAEPGVGTVMLSASIAAGTKDADEDIPKQCILSLAPHCPSSPPPLDDMTEMHPQVHPQHPNAAQGPQSVDGGSPKNTNAKREVEALLSSSEHDGVTEYLVKWKGCDAQDCTWESASALPTGVIKAFSNPKEAEGVELHVSARNKHGFKCVEYVGKHPRGYYRAVPTVNGTTMPLGCFSTAVEAAVCYARYLLNASDFVVTDHSTIEQAYDIRRFAFVTLKLKGVTADRITSEPAQSQANGGPPASGKRKVAKTAVQKEQDAAQKLALKALAKAPATTSETYENSITFVSLKLQGVDSRKRTFDPNRLHYSATTLTGYQGVYAQ